MGALFRAQQDGGHAGLSMAQFAGCVARAELALPSRILLYLSAAGQHRNLKMVRSKES